MTDRGWLVRVVAFDPSAESRLGVAGRVLQLLDIFGLLGIGFGLSGD